MKSTTRTSNRGRIANDSYEIAVQINTGVLETYSPTQGATSIGIGIGMAAGTSPSITGISAGTGHEIAVQINTGVLEVYSPGRAGEIQRTRDGRENQSGHFRERLARRMS
jgi:hypothetical protein